MDIKQRKEVEMKKSHNQKAKEMIQSEHRFIKHCVNCDKEMSIVDFMISMFCKACADEQRKLIAGR